jgi:hypothetical protein
MTTVFPVPVGHLQRDAGQGVVGHLAPLGFETAENVLADIGFLRDFVEPDGRLDGFPLGEEEALREITLVVQEPELEEFAGYAGRLRILRSPPGGDFPAEQIDEVVPVVGDGDFVQLQ